MAKSQTLSGIWGSGVCRRTRCRSYSKATDDEPFCRQCLRNSVLLGLARRSLANPRSTVKILQTVSGKSLAKQSTRQCLAICEAREIHSLNLGRNFGGGAFDEIGGTEPPELSKLVASDFSSSRHALQGLGVNPEECCGLLRVDQRFKTRFIGCRDPSRWFLSEVHCESPLM